MRPTSKIRILSSIVADQIAAGEVVERPASVVKELVENSLDAGAARVTVEIDHGGIGRISVADDGEGMTPEDAALALERHATSKIARLDDLARLTSFGFRGEALPSIASVSRLELVTRTRGSELGAKVLVEGGKVIEVSSAGAAQGTRIDVTDLFYNVPARRKFLKSEGVEAGHCIDAVTRLSLSYPEVTFTVKRDGRIAREMWSSKSQKDKVLQVLDDTNLKEILGEKDAVKVSAFLSSPAAARPGATNLLTYVNRRFVRDRGILKSVWQAYQGMLDTGRYPTGAVFIEIDPALVDFNVHPQKLEVRFSEPGRVYAAVTRVVGELVRSSPWGLRSESTEEDGSRSAIAEGVERYLASEARPMKPLPSFEPVKSQAVLFQEPEPKAAGPRFIGQTRNRYLLFEDDKGLLVLDQHAAHERILFGKLKALWRKSTIPSQQLVMPVSVKVGETREALAEERSQDLQRLGLEVSGFGGGVAVIHSVPAALGDAPPEALLFDVLAGFEEEEGGGVEERIDRMLASMVCHSSVRSGQSLNPAEAVAILLDLEQTEAHGFCPHGRPVFTRISWKELDAKVGRI